MSEIIKLKKVVANRPKRVGRGYGSGKGGHTSGRGQKGQKSRSSINILFEGLKNKKSKVRRLPQLRGKLKFKAKSGPVLVKRKDLEKLPEGSKVDVKILVKYNLVDEAKAMRYGVKIVGKGKISKKLDILIPMSNTTQAAKGNSEVKSKK